MNYLPYYLIPVLLWQLTSSPVLLGLLLAVYLARGVLPDPYLWLKHRGHVRRLRADIAANPENATARRDLALIWLTKRRPARALPLIEEARRREPEAPQLLYLKGQALLESGDAQGAIEPLVEALRLKERMQYGEGYLLCGRALAEVGRHEDAEDAFQRYLKINSSSVQGWALLARLRRKKGDAPGAKKARQEALSTFAHVPGFRRRTELRWYLQALLGI